MKNHTLSAVLCLLLFPNVETVRKPILTPVAEGILCSSTKYMHTAKREQLSSSFFQGQSPCVSRMACWKPQSL